MSAEKLRHLTFDRENDGRLVFITCRENDRFLLTHKHGMGLSVRRALTRLLQLAYDENGMHAEVLLPGNLNKKTFEGVVMVRSRVAAE